MGGWEKKRRDALMYTYEDFFESTENPCWIGSDYKKHPYTVSQLDKQKSKRSCSLLALVRGKVVGRLSNHRIIGVAGSSKHPPTPSSSTIFFGQYPNLLN